MTLEKQALKIVKSDKVYEIEISFSNASSTFIVIAYEGQKLEFEGTDLFHCLQLLREYLFQYGIKVLCNRARFDFYPSRMARSMSAGKKGYILHLGKKGSRDSLVNTFDYSDELSIGTVEEQEDFHKRWIESL